MTRTPAPELSPAEAARVAAFDAAPVPPECDPERVETVARAIADAERAHGPFYFPCKCGWEAAFGAGWEDRGDRHRLMSIAAAAIAALPPSPAEEAVKRAEALADELEREAVEDLAFGHGSISSRQSAGAKRSAVTRLRAALASPAPAPQGEPCGVDPCDCDHSSHDERAKTAAACQRFNQKLIDGAR